MDVQLVYGSRRITVRVTFEKQERLSITVHPDCSVTAKAPVDTSLKLIETRLKRRCRWISTQVAYFEGHQPLPALRQYISGETHYYLGRQYRLRIRCGDKARVRLIGRFFEMELPYPKDRGKAESLLQSWYGDHSRLILGSRLALFLPDFRARGTVVPKIRYRRIKKRWGSCSPNGIVVLNTELAKAPLHCIDYVIIHELCHLFHQHHDQGFYRLLRRVLPDWEKRKERLEKVLL